MITEKFLPKDFPVIAEGILNNSELIVTQKTGTEIRFTIHEIEFYYRNKDHNDQYVHSHEDQLQFGKFYFHRYHTGSYKSGTYKGMDLAFGSPKDPLLYCGILIRSMQNKETKEFIEGPCRCVNKILEILGYSDVKSFMESRQNRPVYIYGPENQHPNTVNSNRESGTIQLTDCESLQEDIYSGPRVGLSDKYPDFRNLSYRFATQIKKIKKQKQFELLQK